jgi:hypothetical protein
MPYKRRNGVEYGIWPENEINITTRMATSGMLRRVALVRTEVSEELSASFIRVTRIGELGKLAVTSIYSQSASVASYG